ncbi:MULTISPECIES: acetoacetate decarboxylase [unclassified Roseitalea]|uniref:acetoacetate decarboxylase n=1 Tax=unclassified Roseitalea TaxID=2639107 RepID=UPI00273EB974|nr:MULTISPECIES: acetoacetate decarboxylase [unclassified Roseitalea]
MADSRYGVKRPTERDIIEPGFATPWDAPMIPPFPFRFRNARILTVYYRTDAEAARFLLPPPLVSTGDVVAIHIYDMTDPDRLGPYGEANVMVGAQLPGGPAGAYSPYLFLSSDIGVAHGREIHGQPKKLAEPRLEFRGDLIVGTVARNGIDVITATLPYKFAPAEPGDVAAHFDFATNINLKAIDHIDGRAAIRQLSSRKLTGVTVHECWSGPCTVDLRPNAQAPVFRLPVREPLTGYFWRADFTLVAGEIIHDYLAADNG